MTFDINMRCGGYFGSALGVATASGKIELVQQLLCLGAQVDPSKRDMHNPFIIAAELNRKDIAELLLRNGADVNAMRGSASFETTLISAVVKGNHNIVSLLLSYGSDIQYRDALATALDNAFLDRHTEIARLLWDAQFPKSEWYRTLIACTSKTDEHRYDAVTVHDIKHYIEDGGSRGYETGGDGNSNYSFDSYDNDLFRSSESTTSAKTV
jgi:ankyrin repeat protein